MQLSPDHSFEFELLRNLAHARYGGADVLEVLKAASKIVPGDLESFHDAFAALAAHVQKRADAIDAARFPVSAREAYFRASTYYRAADFYLHGQPSDPRIAQLWERQTAAFDRAIALLPRPGQRITLRAGGDDGFDIPAIFYAAGNDARPRPVVILGNGFDGAQEEMLHFCGFAALERGYHVITYEGPGQPTVRRNQERGFITEWERVVTPVVDWLVARPDVDATAIALLGLSMGGWLCLRAAAFEPRITAVMAVDGVYDVHAAFARFASAVMEGNAGDLDDAAAEQALREKLASGKLPTTARWGIEHGLWSFNTSSPLKFLELTKTMTLDHGALADKIRCPVWVGEAQDDMFFQGQPEMVRNALGERATYVLLTDEDAAEVHCHVGAGTLMNQKLFDWFDEVLRTRK